MLLFNDIVPIPTYFFCNPSVLPEELTGYEEKGCELCPNLFYLGGKFGLKVLNGLRVGFLCASSDPNDDAGQGSWGRKLSGMCDSLSAESGVDILLTSLWPRGIQRGSNGLIYPTQKTSISAAEAARALRPRYHFAASVEEAPVFWLRSPYRNQSVSATSANYIGSRKYFTTRFCALAPSFNETKQRFLYAIKVVPIDKMSFESEPSDTTEMPYLLQPDEQEQSFFRKLNEEAAATIMTAPPQFQQQQPPQQQQDVPINESNAMNPPPTKRQAFSQRNALRRPENGGCWFCLSNPDVETHLIAYIGKYNYVAIAKGALCDGHAMIIPVEHAPSTMGLSEAARNEMKEILEALSTAFDGPSVAFELRIAGKNVMHSYVQFCPLLHETPQEEIVNAFDRAISQVGCRFSPMAEGEGAEEAWARQNYLWYQLSDGTKFIATPLPQRFPFSLGRGVLAELLGRPEAVDWKTCVGSREAEESMTESLKSILERSLNKQ